MVGYVLVLWCNKEKENAVGAIADILTASQGPLQMYAEKLLVGVNADQFARKPVGKDGVIDTNHPAFIFGHVSIYAPWLLKIIGVEDPGFANPEGFDDLFSFNATCQDDPDGTIYPAMDTITSYFFDAHKRMFAKVAELSDDYLAAPHGQEDEFFQTFPSRGALVAFMAGPHPFTHIGQMSAWRRCMGLGSAF